MNGIWQKSFKGARAPRRDVGEAELAYRLVEIEMTQPLGELALDEGERGIAVLLRYRGAPVAFWMEALPRASVLTKADLARRIEEQAGLVLLAEALRERLPKEPLPERLPSLSVAICTKDRPEALARCLASLQALERSPPIEILVVDNAPSDERTRELILSLPGVHYCREARPGLDFARNRALEEASGELLAYLDDDVVVDRLWLRGLFEAWAENKDAGAFTGLVLPLELTSTAQVMFEQHGGFRRGLQKVRYASKELAGNPLYPCGAGIFGTGANMAFRREVLSALGGFDEALDTGAPLPGGGDLDIFYRVIRAGYPLVYEPRYLVFHQHRQDLRSLRRQYWSWGLGLMAFLAKSFESDPSQRVKICRLVLWWLKYQLRGLHQSLRGHHPLPPGMILAEFWGGVVGLCGEYGRSRRRTEAIRRRFS